MAAYADNDAFVWGLVIASPDDKASLYRVTNGVATLVMTVGASAFSNQSQCGLQVFSLNNIVATTNSQVLRLDSVAKTATPIGGTYVAQSGGLWGDDPSDLFAVLGANVLRWTGARPGTTSPPASAASWVGILGRRGVASSPPAR